MYHPGFGFGARRGAAMRFDEFYRCYPMVMAPGAERPELNYGSKILLPPSALDKVSRMHVQWPLQMELVNADKQRHSHCGVLEFVAQEGRAYIPQWMMQTLQLEVGDMLQVKTTSLELARLVKLQPQSPAFLDINDPKAVLEHAFRNFAALTQGDVFQFEYNGAVYDVAVLEVKPETPKMGVSMIETDVSVDFAPPVGYVEPSTETMGNAGRAFSGPGVPKGGVVRSQGTMAEAINYNAVAPGSEAHVGSKFTGQGHRIGGRKKTDDKDDQKPEAAPDAAKPTTARAGPQPLRLPPNKLFFGFDIRPAKTKEEKDADAAEAAKPQYFAGQGQSLRAVAPKKKNTGSNDEESSGSEKKQKL